jgi:hypothetical protein
MTSSPSSPTSLRRLRQPRQAKPHRSEGGPRQANRRIETNEIFNKRNRHAGGLSSHPLIGCPEKIVGELLVSARIDGVTLSFVTR